MMPPPPASSTDAGCHVSSVEVRGSSLQRGRRDISSTSSGVLSSKSRAQTTQHLENMPPQSAGGDWAPTDLLVPPPWGATASTAPQGGDSSHAATVRDALLSPGNSLCSRSVDISTWEIAVLTSFNFPYGFICSTMGLFILPQESSRMMPEHPAAFLVFSLFVVGISQLACPIAGKLSDDFPASTAGGRRFPFIIMGGALGMIACSLMWVSSFALLLIPYLLTLFVGMVGLNIVFSIQCCLTSDLVPQSLHGKTSGFVALHAVAGSQVGFGVLAITSYFDVLGMTYSYPLMIGIIPISTAMLILVSNNLQRRYRSCSLSRWETYAILPPEDGSETSAVKDTFDEGADVGDGATDLEHTGEAKHAELAVLSNSYAPWSDFIMVFCSRTCYYVATSCQMYMWYYIGDVLGTTDDATRQTRLGIIVFLAQGTAALLAVPFGRLADKEGISKKWLIYFACGMMSFVYAAFLVAPHFQPHAFLFLLPVSVMYGVGNGCFLAVDYALALATTPDKDNSGKALGIWGVSFFVGASVGPVLWGIVLTLAGSTEEGVYSYRGYVAMLGGGAMFTVAAAVLVGMIKAVH